MISPGESELFKRAREGDEGACARLVEENSGLVWSIVRRYFGRGVETDDLYQLGCLGLLKAVRGFDPGYGTCFSTYAVPKIAGEIRRFLRDDGTVKVSRTLRERAARLYAAKDQLAQELGREPGLDELSRCTGFSPEEIAAAETACAPPASLQEQVGENAETTLEEFVGSDGMEEGIVEREGLWRAVAQLPERERKVVALRYLHGMTQERAARVLRVSQVQVSRLEKRAMTALRALLEE